MAVTTPEHLQCGHIESRGLDADDYQLAILRALRDHANPDNRFEYYGRKEDDRKDWRFAKGKTTPDADLERHDGGEDGPSRRAFRALGMDLVLPDGTTHFSILDIDDHDGTVPEADKQKLVACISLKLDDMGIPHKLSRSSGGAGFHVMIVHEQAVPQSQALAFGKTVLYTARMSALGTHCFGGKPVQIGTGGICLEDRHEVEVFPKGGRDHYNIGFPFFGQSVEMIVDQAAADQGKYRLIVGSTGPIRLNTIMWSQAKMQERIDSYENPTKREPRSKRKRHAKKENGQHAPKLADVEKAAECFLKDDLFDFDDYDHWKQPASIMQSAFEDGTPESNAAKECWKTWSGQSEKADDPDALDDWWDKTSESSWADHLTFWKIAIRNGYRGPSPLGTENLDEFQKLNEEWAVVQIGSKVAFMELATRVPLSMDNFKLRMAARWKIVQRWVEWSGRTEFVGLTLEPLDYDGPMYNAFVGLRTQPVPGDVSLFLEYIDGVAGGDPKLAKWLIHWAADIVQRPTEPGVGTAISMKGPAGTGKSSFGAVLRQIIGPNHSMGVAQISRVTGQFNESLFGKCLVCMDEAIFAGAKKDAAMLKELVTGHTWRYERKHVSDFEGKNVVRIVSTTNEAQGNHLDFDDRRWTVMEVNHFWPKSRWKEFHDWVTDGGGKEAILHHLLSIGVDRELIGTPYTTKAKGEDKLMASPVAQVLVDFVEQGYIPGDVQGSGRITTERLKELADKIHGRGSVFNEKRAYAAEVKKLLGKHFKHVAKVPHVDWRWEFDRETGGSYPVSYDMGRKTGVELPPPNVLRDVLSDGLAMDIGALAVDSQWTPDRGPQPEYQRKPDSDDEVPL